MPVESTVFYNRSQPEVVQTRATVQSTYTSTIQLSSKYTIPMEWA